jgi:hypothetical protein
MEVYFLKISFETNAAMTRKNRTFLLDEGIIELVARLASEDGRSANQWLERHLFHLGQNLDKLPKDYTLPGETRGGIRIQSEALEK